MTLHQALVNSCNTVFYAIGRDLDAMDPDYLPRMAKAFGLGAPTGIPYLPEAAGAVPDPAWKLETFGDYWATGDAVNLAIGQGFLQATPLQLATAYAAIANGGYLLQPYIVSEIVDPDGAVEPVGERVVRGRLPVSGRDADRAAGGAARPDQRSQRRGVVPGLRRHDLADRRQDRDRAAQRQRRRQTALLVRRVRPLWRARPRSPRRSCSRASARASASPRRPPAASTTPGCNRTYERVTEVAASAG